MAVIPSEGVVRRREPQHCTVCGRQEWTKSSHTAPYKTLGGERLLLAIISRCDRCRAIGSVNVYDGGPEDV